MAIPNHDRVGKALDVLKSAIGPFITENCGTLKFTDQGFENE